VDISAADELGILVTNIPGANSDAVAEFTVGFMLTLIRFFPQVWEEMRKGGGAARVSGDRTPGKTLGIIGLGQIGSRVSKLGNAFGMKVYAFDPYLSEKEFSRRRSHGVGKGQGYFPSGLFDPSHPSDCGDAQNDRGTRALFNEAHGIPD